MIVVKAIVRCFFQYIVVLHHEGNEESEHWRLKYIDIQVLTVCDFRNHIACGEYL